MLRFTPPVPTDVLLVIYDVRGRLIRKLTEGTRGVGTHVVNWDGRDREGQSVPAGTYFGMLTVNIDGKQDVQVRKMVITH